jgi:hypothetical protein
MKRLVKRAVMILGVFALMAAFAVPSAEAGRRHRHRAAYYGCGTVYRAHHVYRPYHSVYRPYHSVYRVRAYAAPVVVVPTVRVAVPYYSYYRSPSVYLHVW